MCNQGLWCDNANDVLLLSLVTTDNTGTYRQYWRPHPCWGGGYRRSRRYVEGPEEAFGTGVDELLMDAFIEPTRAELSKANKEHMSNTATSASCLDLK